MTKTITKLTSMMIATILLTGMIGSMGQSAHAVSDTISFEEYDELTELGAVITATNTVTFKIDDDSTDVLGDLPDGIVVTGADGTKYGFSGTGTGNGNVEDQVPCQAALGDLNSLSNNIPPADTLDGADFRTEWRTHDYVLMFDQPVTNLSLDVYDWGDWPTVNSVGTLTLEVFSDSNGDTLVGTATFSNPADGGPDSCLTLSVQDPDGGSILSARVSSDIGDSGTAIDNITFDTVPLPPQEVDASIDVKPTSCPNPVNVKSKGVLPVAIIGSAELDVADINLDSILLEGVSPIRSEIEDVTTPFEGELEDDLSCTTDGADGFDDLTLKFNKQAIIAAIGPVGHGDVVTLTLTGALDDETELSGQDNIRIIAKGK